MGIAKDCSDVKKTIISLMGIVKNCSDVKKTIIAVMGIAKDCSDVTEHVMEVARHKPKIVPASRELQSIARRRLRNDVHLIPK